ncbi:Methanol methyltransferase corrinoid protein [Desulfosporosinus sp. I2]|uniref:cobalamin B12-binding domain-containing protein n=1 Tax=Desulfosporosinus sp. I2 TaxID=1617025 RepID=UPI0005ED8A56|nr:B12-binding domain-containing protein [Desulfosporosinus sp. I2]KJR44972.1 Methanol methyltransferase corrinoid protein [Desulfosporosinus sp. I2]
MKPNQEFSNIFVRYDLNALHKDFKAKGSKTKLPRSSLQVVIDTVIAGENETISDVVQQALTQHTPLEVIREGLIRGMEEVGYLWRERIYYLPQTLAASDTMQIGIEICEAKMGHSYKKKAVVVTHTADGDLHDLGQKIVNALLRASGFEVIDLGKDVPVEEVLVAVEKYHPIMLTGTAGLTLTMNAFERISQELSHRGLELPFVCGGGGGVTADFVTSFQFGIYGADAAQAPQMAEDALAGKSWLELRKKYNG